jgi:AraC family transcriptional regulator of adaptative response/methylated-DNA-[protein]-cysteine methyltransferase
MRRDKIAERDQTTMYVREEYHQELLNDEQRWQAVMARRREADGTFVFAVRSTGIYCRPSCPARRPRREQVIFFQRSTDAQAAGFRPCQRCHPHQESQPQAHTDIIGQVCSYIETHLDMPLHLSDLSQQFHMSPYHLQRLFKRIKGVTPRQYAESCRLEQFKARLQEGENVTSALYNAGYQSSSRVYEHVQTRLGMTPQAYRRGGKGMHIGYAIVESPLGYALLAATARGVAAVHLGESEAGLEADLKREYPEAELIRDEEGLRPWITLLLEHLHGHAVLSAIPLDVQATTFQWKVWEMLKRIPVGEIRSYQDIACAIGQPTATRAVARACATNPVAVIIPCHRVVRQDGQLGGYRWGEERKRKLLDLERQSCQASATSDADKCIFYPA